jgi:hypothetical protein
MFEPETTQATRCQHCPHGLLVHVSRCHVKGCKCPGYAPRPATPQPANA